MKKFKVLATAFLLATGITLTLAACGGGTGGTGGNGGNGDGTGGSGGGTGSTETEEPQLNTFSGITFSDATYTYDGNTHSLTVDESALPQGTHVSYTNNKATDVGTYAATATLTCTGYETKTLNATLTINKATFGKIEFANRTFVHDGNPHSLTIDESTLPQGTHVSYTNNEKTQTGTYTVTATLENPNYVKVTLNAQMEIVSLGNAALNVVNSLLNRPDPWSFMPEALAPENMACASAPVGGIEGFANFVNISSINKKSIGKQLNVVYDIFDKTESALSKANVVFTAGDAIASVYQTFINDHPEDYKSFTGSVTIAGSEFKLKITTEGNSASMLIGNSTVNIELSTDGEKDYGRIQVTDGVALKYKAGENFLKLAVKYTVNGTGVLQQIEFARNNSSVSGYLYEYFGTADKGIKTCALITSDNALTSIISNKRETEDLQIHAYEEVYNSQTGEMVGGEVTENVKNLEYDTLWFNLYDVTGLNTIKVEDAVNGTNSDTIYINGNSEAIHTKLIGGISLHSASRRFDIEMKDVWYIVAKTESGETKYEKVKTQIPMLFVQKDYVNSFNADFEDKNSVAVTLTTDTEQITYNFTAKSDAYIKIKNEFVSYDTIIAYIGEKNEFLN